MPDHYSKKITSKDFSGKAAWTGQLGKQINANKKEIKLNSKKISTLRMSSNYSSQGWRSEHLETFHGENGKDKNGGGGGLLKILQSISDNMESIKNTILNQQKFDTKSAEDDRKEKEKAGRLKKEKDLEGKFQGLKTVASKVLAPIKSMWERLLDFVTTIFLGRVAIKLFEWFSDKENQEKIKAIGRFFKDFWPVLLAGYLLFGNALSKFIIGFGVKLVAWSAKLIAKVIPALGKALAKMKLAALGKGALIAGGVVAAGAGIYGIGKMLGKDKVVENETKRADTSRKGLEEAPSTADLSAGDREALVQGTRLKDAGGGGTLNTMPDQFNDPLGLRQDPTGLGGGMRLNQGGSVPGSGPNTDTVPAMLTPGEFVMSRGAVQKYGVDTLESMNAAAGGTNRPELPGLGGGGGGTNSLTEQAKVKTWGSAIRDFFSGDDGESMRMTDLEMSQRMAGGGEVKQLGTSAAKRIKMKSLESKKTYLIEVLKESKEKIAQSEKSIAKSNPKVNVPKAPEKKKSTVAYDEQKALAQQSQQNGQSPVRQDLPSIDAGAMISLSKIKTLGISV